jgi:hypothetical protein
MSDTSKNKDNSSDGGDEAKKMVLRSATNSIRNKKWSEDVDEAEYEVDSDGEDTDYGNSSRVSFFPSPHSILRRVCSYSHLVLTAGSNFSEVSPVQEKQERAEELFHARLTVSR